MTIQTRWLTAYYNPQQEPPEVHPETDHHLVYAAMLDGVIGAEYLTDQELEEIEFRVQEFCMQKEMDRAQERGCSVFDGVEGDPIQ